MAGGLSLASELAQAFELDQHQSAFHHSTHGSLLDELSNLEDTAPTSLHSEVISDEEDVIDERAVTEENQEGEDVLDEWIERTAHWIETLTARCDELQRVTVLLGDSLAVRQTTADDDLDIAIAHLVDELASNERRRAIQSVDLTDMTLSTLRSFAPRTLSSSLAPTPAPTLPADSSPARMRNDDFRHLDKLTSAREASREALECIRSLSELLMTQHSVVLESVRKQRPCLSNLNHWIDDERSVDESIDCIRRYEERQSKLGAAGDRRASEQAREHVRMAREAIDKTDPVSRRLIDSLKHNRRQAPSVT